MELYFSPLACSAASRILVYETGRENDVVFRQVDDRSKRLVADGADYLHVNPLGLVPALRTDDGRVLTENAVILPYLWRAGATTAAPPADEIEPTRWMAFVSTELHKQVFTPLLNSASNEGARDFARASAPARWAVLESHLASRTWMLDEFGPVDAYLVVVMNWAAAVQLDLAPYPALRAYLQRALARPAVSRALREETALWRAAHRSPAAA